LKLHIEKEPALLIAVVLIVGLMFARLETNPAAIRGRKQAEALEFVARPAPELSRARASSASTSKGSSGRNLFVKPSDTQALPLLEWSNPERAPLASIFPPPVPGPAPAFFGTHLRREQQILSSLAVETTPSSLSEFNEAGAIPGVSTRDRREGVKSALRELGKRRGFEEEEEIETPAQRAARKAGYRRVYDWIELGDAIVIYGSIVNEDRFGFSVGQRPNEPVLFLQIEPKTGREAFPGLDPIAYDRERVTDMALADSRGNQLELEAREIRVTQAMAGRVLSFAKSCLEARHEAPRALDIARGLLNELAAIDPDDPAARLGLARCFEAEFDFESAFIAYREMLDTFAHRSEVFVALAELETRCLLFDAAEERLNQAIRVDRNSWGAQWALGKLLARKGQHARALEALQIANQNAPSDAGTWSTRVEMRTDLASALLRMGDVESAMGELVIARRLDPLRQSTLAAIINCALLKPAAVDSISASASTVNPESALQALLQPVWDLAEGETESGDAVGVGFELLMSLGLWSLEHGDLATARARLESAAAADPLRACTAWRALSTVSELAGLGDDAMRAIDLALDSDPTDAWSLYQRGRLLVGLDELEEAQLYFEAALEQDLDFDDALVAIGELLYMQGEFEAASRYLDRALSRDAERVESHRLSGLVEMGTGAFFKASAAFEKVLLRKPKDPIALGGIAWCTYQTGDASEALILLAQLIDSRRDLPETDVYRVWAQSQIDRLTDHLEKVAWSDGFARTVIRNGWQIKEGAGPLVQLDQESVRLSGSFRAAGTSELYREYPANSFVSIEASLWVADNSPVRAGLFVARERRRGRDWRRESEVSIARHWDGAAEVRIVRSASEEPEIQKTDAIPFPTGRWVRVRIERTGTSEAPTMDVFMDDVSIVASADFPQIGRSGQPLRVGVFVEGDTGRLADLIVDDVVVVYREALQ
jgi:tetratricopeptide (TPR) repeat protein